MSLLSPPNRQVRVFIISPSGVETSLNDFLGRFLQMINAKLLLIWCGLQKLFHRILKLINSANLFKIAKKTSLPLIWLQKSRFSEKHVSVEIRVNAKCNAFTSLTDQRRNAYCPTCTWSLLHVWSNCAIAAAQWQGLQKLRNYAKLARVRLINATTREMLLLYFLEAFAGFYW